MRDYPGSRWWKFDFHSHTPASYDYRDRDSVTPEDWLLGYMRAGVDCVAVTDHNSGAWIDPLKLALIELEKQEHPDFRPLHLFPGVEITASDGTHILAILDPDKTTSDVDRLIGLTELRQSDDEHNSISSKSVIEVLRLIADRQAIAIPAHVDRARGLWGMNGNALEAVLASDHVFAIEVADSSEPKPEQYEQRRLGWAEVLGSDSHRLAGTGGGGHPGSHYTWVKMENPNLDGLRLALLDGARFSIRRSDDPEPLTPPPPPDQRICSIAVDQAKLMGRREPATLSFSPWLNVLIGGRGTGKSTVLNCLRLVAQRESELDKLDQHSTTRTTFERFNRQPTGRDDSGGLTADTHITWTLSRRGVLHRVHWPADAEDSDTIVEDESSDGGWVASAAQHVDEQRFPIRLFNQGQISELAGNNQSALLKLIDEGAKAAQCEQALEETGGALMATRVSLRAVDAKLARHPQVTVELEDIERQLAAFEDSGQATTIQAYQRIQRQQRELDRHFDVAQTAAQQGDELADTLLAEDIGSGIFDPAHEADRDALSAINAARGAIGEAATQVRQTAEHLREVISEQRSLLAAGAWQSELDAVLAAYNAIAGARDGDANGYAAEHTRLVQDRQLFVDALGELASTDSDRTALVAQQANEMESLRQARRALSESRAQFLAETLAQNRYVRIQLVPYGDNLRAAEDSLREALGLDGSTFEREIGGGHEDASADAIVNRLLTGLSEESDARSDEVERRLVDLRAQFTNACAGSEAAFGTRFDRHLKNKHDKAPEFLDRLLTWFPPDSLHVKHRMPGKREEFRSIDQGSAGQRAAAMLAFLLAHGDEPLILDQPEDDLDNQLIYDLVVQQIRENKLRRQIIAVTHNPNIVVNGDAEMVNVLDFAHGQCVVSNHGSLQHPAVRDQVCEVMEGGRVALERRYRRLEAGLSRA